MRNRQINPIDLINNHFANLNERFKSTADDHEKNVLRKRLINLQGVKQFLVAAETDTTVNPSHSISPGCM
jgi:hypothetical protein